MIEPRSAKSRRDGAVLLTIISVIVITIVFSGALLSIAVSSTRASREGGQIARCDAVLEAAVADAFHEIRSRVDPSGNGYGALGVVTPVSYTGNTGELIGEYKSIVVRESGRDVLLAAAAVPTFNGAEATRTLRAVIRVEPTFLLAPRPGAMSVSGPIHPGNTSSSLFGALASNPDLTIDGGSRPALTIGDGSAYTTIMESLGDLVTAANEFDGSELLGPAESPYVYTDGFGIATELQLPVAHDPAGWVSPLALDEFRNQIRGSVLALADSAVSGGVVQSGFQVIDQPVTSSSVSWGTAENPLVTIVDAGAIGPDGVFATDGQTVTGHGTLIVRDALRASLNLNLDWTGDIYVVGSNSEPGDLLGLRGGAATVRGNLLLLSDGSSDARLVLGESANDGSSGNRSSSLSVEGSVVVLAEASTRDASLRVEQGSSLHVHGLTSVFGSRAEVVSNDRRNVVDIDGSLSVGVPGELDGSYNRTDDLTISLDGTVGVRWNEGVARAAVQGLEALQASHQAGTSADATNWRVALGGVVAGNEGGTNVFETIEATIAELGPEHDYGLSVGGTSP